MDKEIFFADLYTKSKDHKKLQEIDKHRIALKNLLGFNFLPSNTEKGSREKLTLRHILEQYISLGLEKNAEIANFFHEILVLLAKHCKQSGSTNPDKYLYESCFFIDQHFGTNFQGRYAFIKEKENIQY